jgi:hypothetical protein
MVGLIFHLLFSNLKTSPRLKYRPPKLHFGGDGGSGTTTVVTFAFDVFLATKHVDSQSSRLGNRFPVPLQPP